MGLENKSGIPEISSQIPPKPNHVSLSRRGFLTETARAAAKVVAGITTLAAVSGIDKLINPPSILAAGEYFKQLNGTDTQLLDKELKEASGEAKVIGFFTTRTMVKGVKVPPDFGWKMTAKHPCIQPVLNMEVSKV